MGQTFTQKTKSIIPEQLKIDIRKIHVEIVKDLAVVKDELCLMRDLTLIDWNYLRESTANLNTMLRSCFNDSNEKVFFGLQCMDEDSIFWKPFVRIICFKVNAREREVSITRTMNIRQFWKLRCEIIHELYYKELISDDNGFELINLENETANGNGEEPVNISNYLSVSTIIRRVNEIKPSVEEDECLICMDNKVDVSLPCAHGFCSKCIHQWSIESPTCPTCREQIKTTKEIWEFTDMPDADQMNKNLIVLACGGTS